MPTLPAEPPPFEIAAEQNRHVRLFLAVNFPVATVRRIAEEITALKGPIAAAGLRVRWVPAANLHLTLKFLGPVRAPVVEAIRARLFAGLRELRPFEIEARGLGAFPSIDQARVLWVGVREQPALTTLAAEIEAWMGELGFAKEERAYHPHVTIGRVTVGPGDAEKLAPIFAERAERSYGTGRVGEVVIYESRTLARGAEYRALGRVGLSL